MTSIRWTRLLVVTAAAIVLACAFSPCAFAGRDASILDWNPADIYVDNNGNAIHDEPGEPSKGIVNRLFARVRNLGTTPATNVTVTFAYAPYGIWGWNSYSQFKAIPSVTGVTLDPAGSPGAEKIIEVQWDLRNLAENNGGLWGGYTVGDFDHFCVWVKIECPEDTDTGNNQGRVNFCNVITGETYSLKFLMFNPNQEIAKGELVFRQGIPKDWKYELRGLESPREIVFKPKEFKLVTLVLTPPKGAGPVRADVDIALRLNGELIPGITFGAVNEPPAALTFPPSGGMLSPYLTGTYDLRAGRRTVVQVINPTAGSLRVVAVFFDDKEKPLACARETLSANDLWELDVSRLRLAATFGVVKIVSFDERQQTPAAGIVGYQRQLSRLALVSEAPLHAIPRPILMEDLPRIMQACK